MKYKTVKEINGCYGCINCEKGMCKDFIEQRTEEDMPSCGEGFIYVEDKHEEIDYRKELLEIKELYDDLCELKDQNYKDLKNILRIYKNIVKDTVKHYNKASPLYRLFNKIHIMDCD